MKNYIVYKIFMKPFNAELLSGIFWEFNIAGLIEENDHIKIFTSQDSDIAIEAIEDAISKLQNDKLLNSYRIEKELLEDKNWNELWEKSREVIRISERIVIKPSFKQYYANENEIVLTIDPKMSFGTGEHPSTKLVLRLLEKYVKKGMKVLDVGSGTGILSITSIKLGATRAVAVDFDEICLENSKENCIINSVQNNVDVLTGEIDSVKENHFDLILANIHKNVLIEIAEKIKSRIHEKGKIILAGLLESDREDIEVKYNSLGFKTEELTQMNEWISIVFGEMKSYLL